MSISSINQQHPNLATGGATEANHTRREAQVEGFVVLLNRSRSHWQALLEAEGEQYVEVSQQGRLSAL